LHLDKAEDKIHVHRAVVAWSRGQELGLQIRDIELPEERRLSRYLRRAR